MIAKLEAANTELAKQLKDLAMKLHDDDFLLVSVVDKF